MLQFSVGGGVATYFVAGAAHSERAGLHKAQDQFRCLVFIAPAAFGDAGQIAHRITGSAGSAGEIHHQISRFARHFLGFDFDLQIA